MLTLSPVSKATADNAIIIARRHLGTGVMDSSARLCLTDAINAVNIGQYGYALERAKKSIAYSVGIMHADYRKFN